MSSEGVVLGEALVDCVICENSGPLISEDGYHLVYRFRGEFICIKCARTTTIAQYLAVRPDDPVMCYPDVVEEPLVLVEDEPDTSCHCGHPDCGAC